MNDVRIGLTKAYVSEGMVVVMLGLLVTEEAGRLYSSHVSADARMNCTPGTES